jgi:hypothetical protein
VHALCPLWTLSFLIFGKKSITGWPESAVNYNPSTAIAVGLGAKKFSQKPKAMSSLAHGSVHA